MPLSNTSYYYLKILKLLQTFGPADFALTILVNSILHAKSLDFKLVLVGQLQFTAKQAYAPLNFIGQSTLSDSSKDILNIFELQEVRITEIRIVDAFVGRL